MSTDVESLQRALKEHYEILDALEARNGARAREAMVNHIAAWQRHFVENFPR
jgi:DNA-binding GntR family transcriptional regulator